MIQGAQEASPARAAPGQAGGDASPHDAALRQLQDLVQRAERRGVRSLSAEELTRLPVLYRFAATRLSRAQTSGRNAHETQRLAKLVARSHALLYRDLSAPPGSLLSRGLRLLLHDAPRTIREEWRVLAASLALFYGLALVTYLLVGRDLELAFTFLDPQVVAQELDQLRQLDEDAQFRGNFTFGRDESATTAGWLIARNVGVTLLLFAAALIPPLFLFIVAINALMLGTYFGVAAHWDQAGHIASILMCHGVLELQALALAGAAGCVLARGLFLPGPWTRAQSMRRESARAWRLYAGIFPMLVMAGCIEAYVSPHAGREVRVGFMVGSALLLAAWVGLGGRASRSSAPVRATVAPG